jgi:hypothetical protein
MEAKMKKLILLILPVILFSGCSNDSDYDRGYENAWDDENKPSGFATDQERRGYEDGLADADAYDSGYDDGINRRRLKYRDDDFYYNGYEEGKKDR